MHPPRVGSRTTAAPAPAHPRAVRAPADPPPPTSRTATSRTAASRTTAPPRRMVMALAARPQSVPLARSTLRRLLTAWRADTDEDAAAAAALILSELVTNAITHGTAADPDAGSVTLSVALLPPPTPGAPRVLRLSVHDPGSSRPLLRSARTEEEHGRGLLLVSATADRWDCEPLPGDGKRVWAELDVRP
ncbi:ATP-binding protein [Streptomyces sp. NPDC092296]|uniref:ATP-binding protein n=1 Tax=Streptomyces sp. NPDC092296 TaxID=3366012 RepID=UPI003813A113